jgi:hypothetical protein
MGQRTNWTTDVAIACIGTAPVWSGWELGIGFRLIASCRIAKPKIDSGISSWCHPLRHGFRDVAGECRVLESHSATTLLGNSVCMAPLRGPWRRGDWSGCWGCRASPPVRIVSQATIIPGHDLLCCGVDDPRQVDVIYPTYDRGEKVYAFVKTHRDGSGYIRCGPDRVGVGIRGQFVGGKGELAVKPGTAPSPSLGRKRRQSKYVDNQLWSPWWGISPVVNARETLGSPAENLLEVASPPGQHEFELVFTGRVAERAGTSLMLVSFLIATIGIFLRATRSKPDPIGK